MQAVVFSQTLDHEQVERPQTSGILHAKPPTHQAKCKDQDSLAVHWLWGMVKSPTRKGD